jgi:hypothetical protein
MAQAGSRRRHSSKARVRSHASLVDSLWGDWHWDRFFRLLWLIRVSFIVYKRYAIVEINSVVK